MENENKERGRSREMRTKIQDTWDIKRTGKMI